MTRVEIPVLVPGAAAAEARVARRPWWLAGLLASALVISGCSIFGGKKATTVEGNVIAAKDLNPSVSQRPSPLTLRIYELKSDTAFNRADFMSLYQSDQASLGADVLVREEFVVQPGETRPYKKTLNPDTRFIAVFGAYRDLERARWRTVVPVQPGKAQTLTVRADALGVSAQVQQR
ncbi:MAG: type VI secretion system lipoprotein TssJ [Pseudomonadota bacterium]|nr:type VI secretion system lipoprotein TssJ [Pseudomonadota bacterium]